jgi:flavin-dependent dehydrogenase
VTAARSFDVIVVGGGPAGSSSAWSLARSGLRVAVLDREVFPRTKLCAGWVTPDVLRALDLAPAAYPHGLLTFDRLVIHVKGLSFPLRTVQHSIRRFEFDDFLLRRSGASIVQHTARQIRIVDGGFEIDGGWRGRYLIGAGGTRCPVYRTLFRDRNPRASELQVVAFEQEFQYAWRDPRCHLWFFDNGLPGYSWYVPKANGWLNCGIGAMADKLKSRGEDIRQHWDAFARMLDREGLVRGVALEPQGYSYFLRGNVAAIRAGNACIAGDSVGLATVDLGEGIGPAIRSGLAAARALLEGGDYSLGDIAATSADQIVQGALLRKLARAMLASRFPAAPPSRAAA